MQGDSSSPNGDSVVLKRVTFKSTGIYRCEVTTRIGPKGRIQMKESFQKMIVVGKVVFFIITCNDIHTPPCLKITHRTPRQYANHIRRRSPQELQSWRYIELDMHLKAIKPSSEIRVDSEWKTSSVTWSSTTHRCRKGISFYKD